LVYQARIHQPSGGANSQAWCSDGTAEGTFPLVSEGEPFGFSQAAGAAFFQSEDGFWTSDGTVAGTRLISGIDTGIKPTELAGDVFLPGHNDASGFELYRLDGLHGDRRQGFRQGQHQLVPGCPGTALRVEVQRGVLSSAS